MYQSILTILCSLFGELAIAGSTVLMVCEWVSALLTIFISVLPIILVYKLLLFVFNRITNRRS